VGHPATGDNFTPKEDASLLGRLGVKQFGYGFTAEGLMAERLVSKSR
jgi:hypothetical protein